MSKIKDDKRVERPEFDIPNIKFEHQKGFDVKTSQIPPMDVAFDPMALTDYELLVATIYKLQDLILVTNSYSELIEKILKWVVGDGLEQTIKDILIKWDEEGYLAEIINEALFESKLDKEVFEDFVLNTYNVFVNSTNNNFSKIEGELIDFKNEMHNVISELVSNQNSYYKELKNELRTVDEKIIPSSIGGVKLFTNIWEKIGSKYEDYYSTQGMTFDGQNFYMVFIPTIQAEGEAWLRKFDYKGNLIMEKKIKDVGHSNSMSFYENKIYLSPSQKNEIKVYDKTLNEVETINCDVHVASLSVIDNEIWTTGNKLNTVSILNMNGVLQRTILLDSDDVDTINQSFTVDSKYIYYIRSIPDTLYIFNLDGKLIKRVQLNTLYSIKEYEDISVIGKDIYISYQTGGNKYEWYTGVFKFSFDNYVIDNRQTSDVNTAISIYVDNSSLNMDSDGSELRPFQTIQMAIDHISFFPNSWYKINLKKTDAPYPFFRVIGANNITIYGNNSKLNSFQIFASNNIVLIDGEISSISGENYCALLEQSVVKLINCSYEFNDVAIIARDVSQIKLMGSVVTLKDSSVKIESGSSFSFSRTNYNKMVLPIGTSWSSDAPILLWEGSESVGTFNFRKDINVSYFRELELHCSTGDIITVKADTNNKFRCTNFSGDGKLFIIAENSINSTGNSFTLAGFKGMIVRETSVELTDTAFKVQRIYGK